MQYYAGIGSRRTPTVRLQQMKCLAVILNDEGYILRSGGAEGADKAFESGANKKEIFLMKHATEQAEAYSKRYHPNWDACSFHARKLLARNAQIILGPHLETPVEFVICWIDVNNPGGTAHSVRIADANNIPVYNMANNKWADDKLLTELDNKFFSRY